jgi:hypothetical protein
MIWYSSFLTHPPLLSFVFMSPCRSLARVAFAFRHVNPSFFAARLTLHLIGLMGSDRPAFCLRGRHEDANFTLGLLAFTRADCITTVTRVGMHAGGRWQRADSASGSRASWQAHETTCAQQRKGVHNRRQQCRMTQWGIYILENNLFSVDKSG